MKKYKNERFYVKEIASVAFKTYNEFWGFLVMCFLAMLF